MQTFLPFADFRSCARVLDRQRLGKQRVEAWQILRALRDPSYGWQSHPAVRMWRGYENALIEYGIAVCDEWLKRGYKGTMRERFRSSYPWHQTAPRPPFIGSAPFHRSHRSNLLRKLPEHYRKFWPKLSDSLPYIWPV